MATVNYSMYILDNYSISDLKVEVMRIDEEIKEHTDHLKNWKIRVLNELSRRETR